MVDLEGAFYGDGSLDEAVMMAEGVAALSSPAVVEFVAKWALRQEAQEQLISLPEEFQQKVLNEFAPRDTSRDANGIFLKFVSGIVQAHKGGDDVERFADQWNLNDEARRLLASLKPLVQMRVMQEFAPRDAESDANNIFMKFAQGVANGAKGGGKSKFGVSMGAGAVTSHVVAGGVGRRAAAMRQPVQYQAQHVYTPHVGVQTGHAYAQPNGFHDADDATVGSVHSAESFATKRVATANATMSARAWGGGRQYVSHAQHGASRLVSKPKAAVDGKLENAIADFVAKWGLQHEAHELLASLTPEVQQKVMREFAPRDTSRDANGIFLKFAAGVAATQAHAEVRGADVVTPTAVHEAETFAARWALGEEARNLLFSLPQDARVRVLTEFAPRDASSDVNNIFMKFAQGVARGQGKAGKKGRHSFGIIMPSVQNGDRFAPY